MPTDSAQKKPAWRRRKARPERIRISFYDDATGSMHLPLPSQRMRPVGVVFAVMFAIFAWVAFQQIASMWGQEADTVFDLMVLLFQGFWVLGWSVGVLILFLLTVLFLFYRESARIIGSRLIYVPRLGPLKIFLEYDLVKIRNLRLDKSGRSGRAQIRFDYGRGANTLGSDMPRAEAESRLQIIESAIAALNIPEPGAEPGDSEPEQAPSEGRSKPAPHSPSEVGEFSWTSPSSLALIGANLVPLAGVLLLGWDLGQIMTLFWAENAVIGFYNLLKLGVVAKWGILFVGPFFVGHYGGFMAGHFLFIYYLFVRGVAATGPEPGALAALAELFGPLWPALVALLLSHGISFFKNFLGRNEYVGRKVSDQMGEPYKRIILLHVTIIFGGWMILLLKSPLPALVLLIALKTAVDLRAHRKEHSVRGT